MAAYVLNGVAPGADPLGAGSIDLFRSEENVFAQLEPWFADETYILIRSDGRRMTLISSRSTLEMREHDDRRDCSGEFRMFLARLLSYRGIEASDEQSTPELIRQAIESGLDT